MILSYSLRNHTQQNSNATNYTNVEECGLKWNPDPFSTKERLGAPFDIVYGYPETQDIHIKLTTIQ